MRAAYAPYRLQFIEPGGTSRGVLHYKDTYLLKVWDESNPEIVGLGECALFKGLSAEDNDQYENKLRELCQNIHHGQETELCDHSSIMFGLESALNDLASGGKRIYFPSDFTSGKQKIKINGLVWMGTKEKMLERIDQKVAAGFHTIKLKIGAIDFESELSLIRYIRTRYSAMDLEIRVDANGAFSPDEAPTRLEALSKLGLHSIEQPIKAGQWEEMAKLCRTTPLPIALDEELIGITNPMVMLSLLRTIQPQYIILKPSLCGGFLGATDWLKMAYQLNIGGWITSALESNIGLAAIAQWTATLKPLIPQGLGTGMLYSNNFSSPLEQTEDFLWYNCDKAWDINLNNFNWIEQ